MKGKQQSDSLTLIETKLSEVAKNDLDIPKKKFKFSKYQLDMIRVEKGYHIFDLICPKMKLLNEIYE
jgi:hypothetical protein